MLFRNVLYPALKLTYKSKRLWFFSILTLTALTIANEWQWGNTLITNLSDPVTTYRWLSSASPAFQEIKEVSVSSFFQTLYIQPLPGLSFILALILTSLVVIFASFIIINAQALIIFHLNPERSGSGFSLKRSLRAVHPYWQKLFLMNVLLLSVKLLIFVYLLIVSFISVAIPQIVLFWCVVAVLIILVMSLSYTIRLAMFELIYNKENFITALGKGFQLFKKNYLTCFEFSFIFFAIITISATLVQKGFEVFFGSSFILAVPILLSGSALTKALLVMLIFIALLFIVLFGGFLSLFQYAGWMFLKKEFEKHEMQFSYLANILTVLKRFSNHLASKKTL